MVFIDFLSFKYLGAILQNDGKISKDVHERYKLSG